MCMEKKKKEKPIYISNSRARVKDIQNNKVSEK